MKNCAKIIMKHFGIKNQQKKLTEEVHELNEAITILETSMAYREKREFSKDDTLDIAEEITDCMLLLYQILLYYNIAEEDLLHIAKKKIDRTMKRMESGYYAKK